MNPLVIHPSSTAQWHTLINEAQCAAHCQIGEDLESYLVFMLMRFTTRPDMHDCIIASEFLEENPARGCQRHEHLRDIGDHCLLFSGLFPQQARRRLVNIGYYVAMGRNAYHQIAALARGGATELFTGLAREFVQLMDILHTLRTLPHDSDPCLQPLQAYELWQETGSEYARRTLHDHSSATMLIIDESPDNNKPRH